jgi:tetratricopeptide (TPR) repeat protein
MSATHITDANDAFYLELAHLDEALAAGQLHTPPTPAAPLPVERWHQLAPLVEQLRRVGGATSPYFNWSVWSLAPAPSCAGAGERIGTLVGRYRIDGVAGRGGMGVVYRAWDEQLQRPVALKMLRRSDASPDHLARFLREAALLAQVNAPQLVRVYEIGQHDGHPFLALEYIDGPSLRDYLRTQPLNDETAARVVGTLACVLHTVHEHGIIHRDLKPANVLLQINRSPQVRSLPLDAAMLRLTDFGLAKRLATDASLTQSGCAVGTPNYMAPEQAQQRDDVGVPADVYGLGAILYECVTGRPPFLGPFVVDVITQVVQAPPVAPRTLQPTLSRDLETICLKCLEKAPGQRYASAQALADDLQRFVEHQPILARPIGWPERTLRWGRRQPREALLVTAMLALGLFGVAGLIGWGLQTQHARLMAEQQARRIAEREAENHAQVDEFFVAITTDERLADHGFEPLRVHLLSKAKGYYETWLARQERPAGFDREYGHTLLLLAKVTAATGSPAPALDWLTQLEQMCAATDTPPAQRLLAQTLTERGHLHRQIGQRALALSAYQRAAELWTALDEAAASQTECWLALGELHAEAYALDTMNACFARALALHTGSSADPHVRAQVLLRTARAQRQVLQPAGAEHTLEQARTLWEGLHATDRAAVRYRVGLVETYQELADLYALRGRLALAVAAQQTALRWQAPLVDEQPHLFSHRLRRAELQAQVGILHAKSHNWPVAFTELQTARTFILALLASHPDLTAARRLRVEVETRLGREFLLHRRETEGLALLHGILPALRQLRQQLPDLPEYALLLGEVTTDLGWNAHLHHHLDRAMQWFTEAAAELEWVHDQHPKVVLSQLTLARLYNLQAVAAEDRADYLAAAQLWSRFARTNPGGTGFNSRIIYCYWRAEQPARALRLADEWGYTQEAAQRAALARTFAHLAADDPAARPHAIHWLRQAVAAGLRQLPDLRRERAWTAAGLDAAVRQLGREQHTTERLPYAPHQDPLP